jgi:hypothetical protein
LKYFKKYCNLQKSFLQNFKKAHDFQLLKKLSSLKVFIQSIFSLIFLSITLQNSRNTPKLLLISKFIYSQFPSRFFQTNFPSINPQLTVHESSCKFQSSHFLLNLKFNLFSIKNAHKYPANALPSYCAVDSLTKWKFSIQLKIFCKDVIQVAIARGKEWFCNINSNIKEKTSESQLFKPSYITTK